MRIFSKEHCRKMSEAKKRNWQDSSYRKKKLASMKKRVQPKLTREKISKALTKKGLPYCLDCSKQLVDWRSKKCIQCFNKARIGDKNPSWKGGISRLPYPFDFNKELKELIRKRDNYKCQLCGCPQEECLRMLDIHHIDYDKDNISPDNLITLCRRCNTKANNNRRFWKEFYIKKLVEGIK